MAATVNMSLQRVKEKLSKLERRNFKDGSAIKVAIVGCGYGGVELAATISERLQDRGIVQCINVSKSILPSAPNGNREAAMKVDFFCICVLPV